MWARQPLPAAAAPFDPAPFPDHTRDPARALFRTHYSFTVSCLPFLAFPSPCPRRDLKVINDCLDGLIRSAKETRVEEDPEVLQNRDYSKVCGGGAGQGRRRPT